MRAAKTEKHRLLLTLIVVYLLISGALVVWQYRHITSYQYERMGTSAVQLAEVAANNLTMTDAQLHELETHNFSEILQHPCNVALQKSFQMDYGEELIKYAYLIRALPEGTELYAVNESDADFYGLPVGTELDYVWLLDVIVNENEQTKVASVADYYIDKHRYTHAQSEIRALDDAQKKGYSLWEDEWGTQIAGLVPFYTTEGTYVGLLGVDIYSSAFFRYRGQVLGGVVAMLTIPTLLLSWVYSWLYLRYRSQMSSLAYRDQLTGIYNRRYYDQQSALFFAKAKEEQWPLTVILGDIDDFKVYNDHYGHQQGDNVLHQIAGCLAEIVGKDGSAFAARYGGEEFVILRVGGDPKELCARICREVSELHFSHSDGSTARITISLGACRQIPSEQGSVDDLLLRADQALYAAKAAGKNTFVLDEETTS